MTPSVSAMEAAAKFCRRNGMGDAGYDLEVVERELAAMFDSFASRLVEAAAVAWAVLGADDRAATLYVDRADADRSCARWNADHRPPDETLSVNKPYRVVPLYAAPVASAGAAEGEA